MNSLRHITFICCCITLLLFTSVASFYTDTFAMEEEQMKEVQIGEEEKTIKILLPSTFLQSSIQKSFWNESGDWIFQINSYPHIYKEVLIPPPDVGHLL